MKTTNRLYWTFTVLFAFFMFMSAVPDFLVMDLAVGGFAQIGLPKALVPFLGIAKALGVVPILIPGFPRLKEWAYAGLIFDLIGAVYLIIAAEKPAADWAPVFLPITIGFLSYYYYHLRLKKQNSLTFAQA